MSVIQLNCYLFPYTTLFRSKEKTREEGIEMLNTFSIGFSQITSNKQAINGPEDLKGASIRSPDEPVPIATFEARSEEHTSELQSRGHLVCRLLLEEIYILI